MNKVDFILELNEKLHGLPEDEIQKSIDFYDEIIDDRIEDGVDEQEVIASLGDIDEIVKTIVADIPLSKLVKEKIKPKRKLSVLEIILLVLGSPIWLSILLALCAVVLSVLVVLWSVIIALWSVFASFVACAFAGVVGGIVLIAVSDVNVGLLFIATGLMLAGLSILFFYICKLSSKGLVLLTKKIIILIKNCFVKKEVAQ